MVFDQVRRWEITNSLIAYYRTQLSGPEIGIYHVLTTKFKPVT